MSTKPHVKLDTSRQQDPSVTLHFNYGFGENDDEKNISPDYSQMVDNFQRNLLVWRNERRERVLQRDIRLNLQHIELIKITFQGQFALNSFFQTWYNDYGLEAVYVEDFGTSIIFAIANDNFPAFINGIQGFINKEGGLDINAVYPNNIKFIKSFQLLTTGRIIDVEQTAPLLNFKLVSLPFEALKREAILRGLTNYLNANGLSYKLDEEYHNLEIEGLSDDQLIEIVRNYDVILQVTSALSTVIRPVGFNQQQRTYGFEIATAPDDLPIVGIIDSGISLDSPLGPLIIADEDFNLTNTPITQDNLDRGRGHGTAVAALVALGKKPYLVNYSGSIAADARLLPIKIIDNGLSYISQHDVLEKLRRAKQKYPEIKIFTLTVCYAKHKLFNEAHSTYAYALDQFAYENDCLICICTGNNDEAGLRNTHYDTQYFLQEDTNLCAPSESMNNLTVGAASHSLRATPHIGLATSKEYPALYSRKGHLDFDRLPSKSKTNASLFKPDLLECGGDYGLNQNGMITDTGDSCLELLSADPTESFFKAMGTSFSAPLAANVAVNIQKNYPTITAASIKALMINSSSLSLIRFNSSDLLNRTAGHGVLDENKAIYSNENSITILIEDKIDADTVKILPLNFPTYLRQNDLGKKNGILTINATLCFQFKPVLQHQQGYCPLHIAFGFFKNQTGDDIQRTEKNLRSKLKSGGKMWSQNGRYKSKPIPFSNVQKISFPVNVNELEDEDSTFKLAVQCAVHPQLLPGQERDYLVDNAFSFVITIEESLKPENLTGNLYDEMVAVNEVVSIIGLTGEADADATA